MNNKKNLVFYATVSLSIFIVFLISEVANNYSQALLINGSDRGLVEKSTLDSSTIHNYLIINAELFIIVMLVIGIFYLTIKRIKA